MVILLLVATLAAPGFCLAQGARIDRPVSGASAGKPPPRLQGGPPAATESSGDRQPERVPDPPAAAPAPAQSEYTDIPGISPLPTEPDSTDEIPGISRIPGAPASGRGSSATAHTRRPAVVEADPELAEAQREFDAAFSHYTTLVTTGGEGDVEQARTRYRETYERLKAVKRERGIE